MKNDLDFILARGDHLALEKDHHRGDLLINQKPLKANIYAVLGGHFTSFIGSDHGGHLITPPL
jgi:hypothetical protein